MKNITQTNTNKLDVINYLRGFSITTIVLMHLLQSYSTNEFLTKVSSFGGAGVHTFILCSGFGLYYSYLRKPLSYKQFLKRRFTKVYIPYILIIITSAIIPFYNTSEEKWIELLSHVFLFKMFIEKWECSYGGQFWFVSTIIQFYICWPIIIKLYKKSNVTIAVFISLSWAILTTTLGLSEERIWNSFFLQYLWEFVLGMWLANLYFKQPSKFIIPSYKKLIPISILGVLLTGITGYYGGGLKSFNDIPSLFGYLSIALIVYKLAINFINSFFSYTNIK